MPGACIYPSIFQPNRAVLFFRYGLQHLRAEGDPASITMKFLCFDISCSPLVLVLPKWVHLSLKSKRLSRYDNMSNFNLHTHFPDVRWLDWLKNWHIWSCWEFVRYYLIRPPKNLVANRVIMSFQVIVDTTWSGYLINFDEIGKASSQSHSAAKAI